MELSDNGTFNDEVRTIKTEEGLQSYVSAASMFLSTASVIFGCVSWAVLPKWRQFRHYAFINVLLAHAVILVQSMKLVWPGLNNGFFDFFTFVRFFAFTQWLVLITVMFYIEFVNVFTSLESTRWLYLKANIFCWLLPIVCAILGIYCYFPVISIVYAFQTFLNITLCAIVIFSLCKPLECSEGLLTKVIVSICAFIFTGIELFIPMALFGTIGADIFRSLTVYSYIVIILFLNLFFLMLKSHRTLWMEYWLRKRNNVI